uniref:USP domain-containing protein n=1 Tax=Meloidogyne incognita TaxID=6306 RepID=A0A914MLZ7_MELIC
MEPEIKKEGETEEPKEEAKNEDFAVKNDETEVINQGENEINRDNTPWVKTREEHDNNECGVEKIHSYGRNDGKDREDYPAKKVYAWKNKNEHYSPPKLMVTYREPEECLDENGHRYVGLVNQASTCYLNSLIQTLYMTPEFRNAIYKWQFNGSNAQEHKNIQFQLQKLFLTLQTNQKSSLETKELTTSFGWDSNEAYDQHDVQELCRVMFDALERLWRKSDNSKTIQDLYEGTVEDYVKCLNCGTESMKKDIFLDLPLSVKEFGAVSSYKSVEEALDAFIKPEILNENNQYDCSKCCSKQDAEKGLRITEFPYLLTIQLKRFDFDYESLHRIKLNDRITFPDFLDINGHIYRPPVPPSPSPPKISYAAAAAKPKPEPTDSGEITPEDPFSSADGNGVGEVECGSGGSVPQLDVSNEEKCWLNVNANSDQVLQLLETKGKYIYELFSIMVHQGSAAAGHYFAYIKNMDQNKWFCFNDSSVQAASKHDIYRTFGGWSYGYMNNTNAYMLMYRRVDPQRNQSFVRSIELPLHLKELQTKLLNEEQERIRYLEESVRVVFRCTEERCKQYSSIQVVLNKDTTLDSVFDILLSNWNQFCDTNVKGGEEQPELEHQHTGCARLVLCSTQEILSKKYWNMQEVLVQYDVAPPTKNDDGQIEGGYCVGSTEEFKRPLSSLITSCDRGNNIPEVLMIIDTKAPDAEQFCELGTKYSVNEQEQDERDVRQYIRKEKDMVQFMLKGREANEAEDISLNKEKGQEDDQHNNERRPVAIVPPTFKRSEKTLTIKDDTYDNVPSTSNSFCSENYGYRVDDPTQPPPYTVADYLQNIIFSCRDNEKERAGRVKNEIDAYAREQKGKDYFSEHDKEAKNSRSKRYFQDDKLADLIKVNKLEELLQQEGAVDATKSVSGSSMVCHPGGHVILGGEQEYDVEDDECCYQDEEIKIGDEAEQKNLSCAPDDDPMLFSSSLPSTPMISPVVSDASGDDNAMDPRADADGAKTKEKLMRVKMFLNREGP